ncbi:MAG: glutamate--tRNA ligase [Planctomycetota bacterium]
MERVRIAPSPTGEPHVGTAYIAIFNYAYAKKTNGKFILRIEDTDRTRSKKEYEQQLYQALQWLGIKYDEGPDIGGNYGPYRQSERVEIYKKYASELLEKDWAYRCFCTPERLEEIRQTQMIQKLPPKYDGFCRQLSEKEIQEKLNKNEPFTIRLKVPPQGITSFEDKIRGIISIENSTIDDQILLKSDGFPTYHLANVVDDHLMGITCVIRAEEWIPSTPKHILLYKAFGWKVPVFAHMPLLRNPDRSKISKRKNPTSILWYKKEGFLPSALINFLALQGFSLPDGREIFSLDDIVNNFSFERINTSGPIFDLQKLEWLNGVYIRKLGREEFIEKGKEYVDEKYHKYLEKIPHLIADRTKKLADITKWVSFFENEQPLNVDLLTKESSLPKEILSAFIAEFLTYIDRLPRIKSDEIDSMLRNLALKLNTKPKNLFMALRIAITFKKESLPICESLEIIDREKIVRRLKNVQKLLEGR